jgi:hypothetical protein
MRLATTDGAGRRRHAVAPGLALVLAGLAISGCTEVETAEREGYQPAHIEEIEGSDVKSVALTAEGASRTGVQLARVRRNGRHLVVPYQSVIYDGDGKTWVFTHPKPRNYLRVPVVVDRVEGTRALLRKGPAVGTEIVTVGAIEVYGSELEIGGEH